MIWQPFLRGLSLGAGLIIAIGAQNAFVLKQGLARKNVFAVAIVSSLADIVLIALGVGGVGTIITSNKILTDVATWGGATFLFYYGWRSFKLASKEVKKEFGVEQKSESDLKQTITAALAFSFLNPHVYLDTVVLIGSLGAGFPLAERWWFGGGAMTASVIWFFGLAYGASWLTPFFQRPGASKVLDIIVGIIMWLIAISLIWEPVQRLF